MISSAAATKSFKRLSERISVVVCGVVSPFMCWYLHLCVDCDLVIVYVASCRLIVPLMTCVYVFSAGFV